MLWNTKKNALQVFIITVLETVNISVIQSKKIVLQYQKAKNELVTNKNAFLLSKNIFFCRLTAKLNTAKTLTKRWLLNIKKTGDLKKGRASNMLENVRDECFRIIKKYLYIFINSQISKQFRSKN
jgi:septum formation topological specificity factor MinE